MLGSNVPSDFTYCSGRPRQKEHTNHYKSTSSIAYSVVTYFLLTYLFYGPTGQMPPAIAYFVGFLGFFSLLARYNGVTRVGKGRGPPTNDEKMVFEKCPHLFNPHPMAITFFATSPKDATLVTPLVRHINP